MSAADKTADSKPSDGASCIELDLRADGTLPPSLARRLDEITVRDVAAYNQFIADLTRGREHNIDWWVCRPATRNNHVSSLFNQCMQLSLVRSLLQDGARVKVLVDCPELADTFQQEKGLTVILTGA